MALAIATVSVVSAQWNGKENMIVVPAVQTDKDGGNNGNTATNCGIKFNIRLSGVTKVELESVDGNPLAGTARVETDALGKQAVSDVENAGTIITFKAADKSGFTPGKDYYISTLPCDLYGGYRLSIYKDGLVAHYFGVHQTVERADYIAPTDLVESELEFDDPDAPLVEEERPELDATTTALLRQYQQNPTEENKQALLDQMGLRYDKVVARKKAKLRELERDAKTPDLVEEMQEIVDEMVENRDIRLEQQFLRLIDPRNDDDPSDAWMVLRGASAPNAYIGYAPVTNAEYAAFEQDFLYYAGKENYPVVNITIAEAAACGTPALAFDNGGQSDIIEHKRNGYLAVYPNIDDLARGLEWLVENRSEGMRRYASESIAGRFSPESVAERHLDLYRELVGQ